MAASKSLEEMKARELRAYVRDNGLTITHLTERRKEDLVVLIRQAEAAQAAKR